MNKRKFLNLISAAIAGPAVAPLAALTDPQKLTNWAGNLTYSTDQVHQAASLQDVRIVLLKEEKVKVLGTRHCFNSIADSHHHLLSLKAMHAMSEPDASTRIR